MGDAKRPVVGTLDIETSPLQGHVFGLFDQNIGLSQVGQEWAILSFCWKPLGGGKRNYVYHDNSQSASPLDDRELCQKLWDILNEADFVIAQNGVGFDLKKISARMLMHGMRPFSPVRVLDTLIMARRIARFTSNKLEWLSRYLSSTPKDRHAEFPGAELQIECMRGNPRAWACNKRYNIKDVLATEDVYLRLAPWDRQHPNFGTYLDTTEPVCKVCLSSNVVEDGLHYTNVSSYKRYRCSKCGAFSRGQKMQTPKEKRERTLR